MSPKVTVFIGNFFLSIFTVLTVYILLPFLSSFMPGAYAGLVVAVSGVISVVLFPFLPQLVARYGAQQLAVFFALAEMIALLALAAAPGLIAGVLLIIVTVTLQPFIAYQLDLLLEAAAAEPETIGRVRTTFITAANLGALTAPLLLGALLANSDEYGRVFLAAAAALVPFIVLFAVRSLPKGTPPHLSHIQDTLHCMMRDRDLAAVTFAHFLFYLFVIWAPLYVPIYLHTVIGIPWASLGWMFSVMLIPYVLIEYPAGWAADRLIGDKELMFLGFIIAGSALASLSILTPESSLTLILIILIASRAGAALIESSTEGHFFRRVSTGDISSMSIFRGIWPLANIIGAVAGSLILFYGSYHIFFALTGGFIVIAGVLATMRIRDFR